MAHPERALNMHFYMPPRQPAVDLMSSGRTDRVVLDLLLRELPHYGVFPVGLDVVLDTENHYAAENPALPTGPRELLQRYVDAGYLGVKTGRGFYDDYAQQD
ncbi:3-hydroxyacyl-CoA dehydrogenase family protein [Streptomyces noursei]|uniref:3-hydroxyacyl-CoA dehydrogenase family protein n=1 Tax=Streptomyces noursei TaxID=1971 RepID=UPI0030EFD79A